MASSEKEPLGKVPLRPGSPLGGKAYFIAQGKRVPLWDLVNAILHAAELDPVVRSISPRLAYGLSCLFETAHAVFWPNEEPPMTRFVARELTTAHWFDLTAARRDLDYEPKVSLKEGLHRLATWFKSR